MKQLILFLSLISALGVNAQSFELQNGDLIFQESCSDGVGEAIKDVTSSIDNYRFTHVGIVYITDDDSIFVIEATHPKVVVTPLSEYLYPKGKTCYPKLVVGRLDTKFQHLIPSAIAEGLKLVGKEYDYGFVLGNDKYYCSELIYDIFLKANKDKPVFPLNVMTFKSSDNGEFSSGWIEYFDKLGMDIPEGELGINPGAISRADIIDIVHYINNANQ